MRPDNPTAPGPEHPLADRLIQLAPPGTRSVVRLVVRTVMDAVDDRVVGLSAEIAFFAILSLPPLLLTVVAALGFLPGDQAMQFTNALIAGSREIFTTSTVDDIIEPIAEAIIDTPRRDVVSIGFAIALLTASRAVAVVLSAVAVAYDLRGGRPAWKQRLIAIGVTLGVFVVVPVVVPLILAGPDFGRYLATFDVLPVALTTSWQALYWGGLALATVLAVATVYHLGAPWWTPFRRDVPGAVLAVAIWVASSTGLRTYTERAITGNELYQFLAGPLALLVWLYLLAFGVLLGAELNAELERLWPSPEQRDVPTSERLRRRLADSPAGQRITHLVEAVTGEHEVVRPDDDPTDDRTRR